MWLLGIVARLFIRKAAKPAAEGHIAPAAAAGRLCRDENAHGVLSWVLAAAVVILGSVWPAETTLAASCPANSRVTISHLNDSNCELCGVGEVTIRVNYNPQGGSWWPPRDPDPDLTRLRITENLSNPGLVPIPGTTTIEARYGPNPPQVDPTQSGGQWVWDLGNYELQARANQYIQINFKVRRAPGLTEEDLFSANKSIRAGVSYETDTDSCGTRNSGSHTLRFDRPNPVISKAGRNVDAGQTSYTPEVYGHNNDDVIWRIQIRNAGTADLQDLRFRDLMGTGNFDIRYACPTEGEALTIAQNNGGGSIGRCVRADRDVAPWVNNTGSNSINPFVVTDPFGHTGTTGFGWEGGTGNGFNRNLNGREVDIRDGQSAYVYLVGKVPSTGSCSDSRTNTVSEVQFGCEADRNGAGGISASTSDSARLYTRYSELADLEVDRRLTGVDTNQPVGTKGLMTITLRNQSGGTIKFRDDPNYHHLRDELPDGYVVDPTFTPAISVSSLHGSYRGRVDTVTWTNPVSGTFPLTTTDPTRPLGNTAPEFRLTSSTDHPVYADQRHMMRHGDELTITFGVVLIESDFYDRTANLDVTPEANTAAAQFTDPEPGREIALNNTLEVRFDTFCGGQGTQTYTLRGNGAGNPGTDGNVRVHPEDLDIAIDGAAFILTNDPNQQLTLPVLVTNNGGHDARDYQVFATFGATMDVVSAPPSCSRISLSGSPPQPAPWKVWVNPSDNSIWLPDTATVYQCSSTGAIRPGNTVRYEFQVVKTTDPARLLIDDLTFRADVVGEITLSDGTPLWFPAPIRRPDDQLDRANNYTLDTVWARVIGFNLMKNQVGTCNENNPPIVDTSNGRSVERVEIGEECRVDIHTGGWFGFETPGYAYIAVQNIDVVDQLPDGQAYISSTDPYDESTSLIKNVTLSPAGLSPVTEGWFDWRFNVDDADRIEEMDQWFRVNVTTRVLNDAINDRAAPNRHDALSRNILNSTFDATFQNNNTGVTEKYELGPSTIGYPNEPIRSVDLRITEPHIEVVKEVCNETLYGSGPDCSNWTTHTNEGDTYDSYIYRLTVRNREVVSGLRSAPAYDVVVTDELDAADLVYVLPFDADGLDNDGDGDTDGSDGDIEGTISDNVVLNGVAPVLTFSHTHSAALRRIEPGDQVQLYYRVDPDQRTAPMQQLVNVAVAEYDSLEGSTDRPSGNQTVEPRPNGDIGGAREYVSEPAEAILQIIPLETYPKDIVRLSDHDTPAGAPQDVVIGEEIEFRLQADLPVARLRAFRIRDELPAGLSCIEAPSVNLSAAPYDAAGFTRPDGSPVPVVAPTCAGDEVVWEFGDVVLTKKPAGANVFRFPVSFIARVDNVMANQDGALLSNGQPATDTTLYYVDEQNRPQELAFGQVDARVTEPEVELSKSFTPADRADAADELTVTVTATNTGTANAYNLRILDDLTDRNLTFIQNSASGSDPPDRTDTDTFGANQPVFIWESTRPLAPGATISFTFQVRVDLVAQPLEELENTIQAAWTSLPDDQTALNSSGSIGPDGSADGMRNGALPNQGDALNDYESTARAAIPVPAIELVKTDDDPAVVPTIGAHKPFTLEIRLPEGTSHDLRVQDNLDNGEVSYVLARDANYDVSYRFEGIRTINGQAPAEGAFNGFTAVDGASGTIEWDIGEVVTEAENDIGAGGAVNPRIVISYYARINNDLATDRGDRLRNGAAASYRHGETGAPETVTATTDAVTALEPDLTVAKAVANRTHPGQPAQGGDVLDYTVTIHNDGDSTAWDINIVDAMPDGLTLVENPSAAIDGSPVAGFDPAPGISPDGHPVWGRDNGDNSLLVPAGGTLVFSYAARVVSASGDLGNTVWVDWTSLDGDIPYERTGAGCPDITAPNDYCASATSELQYNDVTSLAKFYQEDSYAGDGSTATDAIARIGDTVVYRLALNLQGGQTRDVRVEDTLPAGMAFESVISINGDTTADYAPPAGSAFSYAPIAAAQLPAAGQTGTLVWQIGTVDNSAGQQPLNIVYAARILPDAGIAHVVETTLRNTARLYYTLGNGTLSPNESRLRADAEITVRQPVIGAITKTDRDDRTSPANVSIATDTMLFRLEACNAAGTAPAYGIRITDVLPPELDVDTLGAPVVSVGGTALDSSAYSYTPPTADGDSLEFLIHAPVMAGQCVTVDYDIGFNTDIPANSSWHNSATLDEYWSLPAQEGQRYGPLGPAIFEMQNAAAAEPPAKVLASASEATVGELIEYRISVPSTPVNAMLHDVEVSDLLDERLELVDVEEISGHGFPLTELAATQPGEVRLGLGAIPAGQQAVVRLTARVANEAVTNAGDIIVNTAGYHFRYSPADDLLHGGDASAAPLRIVEPLLAIAKSVENRDSPGAAPKAGDTLRYTVTLTAAAGDDYSDAFDIAITDQLSLGLAYVLGSAGVDGGNSIGDPVVSGDGVAQGQRLVWSPADSSAGIDVAEGGTVTVTYDAVVLDGVAPRQELINTVVARWTGLAGDSDHERDGSESPAWNDYVTEPASAALNAADTTALSKTRFSDTYDPADADVRIGDIAEYELRLELQEGTHHDLVLTDTLPPGMVFEGVVSVNRFGQTADLTPAVTGDPASGPTVLSFELGTVVNPADGDASNDFLAIVYRARVLNEVHPQVDSLALTNSATLDYVSATGPLSLTDDETVTVLQPNLSVGKSAAAAGGDNNAVEAGEAIAYTVDISNNGTAPAYDTVLLDTLPVGLREGGLTMLGISLVDNATGAVSATLPSLAPSYDATAGVARWDFDTGTAHAYTIPAGTTLRVEYQATVDLDIGAGIELVNAATVDRYYSLDNDDVPANSRAEHREVYGPTATAQAPLATLAPAALNKAITQPTAAIGEPFSYRITVPAVPVNTALYDVRIVDDLAASAADLRFISVAKINGSQSWTPENIGTDTDLIIADTGRGIDIPAGEQIEIEITVVLTDSSVNASGLLFDNTASYSYNQRDGDAGSVVESPTHAHTSAEMEIVGPDSMRLEKTGPATMQVGTPDRFTIAVQNTGSGPAWGTVIDDRLPEGMCETPPADIAAHIEQADGTLVTALAEGTDFDASFAPAPECLLSVTLRTPAAVIEPSQRLVLSYEAALDIDVDDGAQFTNVAAATQWYGADPNQPGSAPVRTYQGTLSDGTPGDSDDEQDAHIVTAEAAVIGFEKTVVNASSGQNPGTEAAPGETLRYTLTIRNDSAVVVTGASVVDHLAPYFVPGSLQLISVPPGADASRSDASGGVNGTGLIDVRGMTLAAQGQPGDTLTVVFEATLAPIIDSGSVVLNQAQLAGDNLPPNDSNETETLIVSAPVFEVLKTSQGQGDDPDVLMAGDVLRYTITVKNIGTEHAVDARLRDPIPANTTYVADSTRLNGVPVADPAPGVSPLQSGLLLHAPEDPTPGAMRADASITDANVATVVFDVRINDNVVDGTIIANQGFVNADGTGSSGPIPEQPSDDPRTPIADDPTRDVVGNMPLIGAHKTVQIQVDQRTIGIADPEDTLRYTIRIENFGAIPASDVRFTDLVPANTTYVAESVTLNGQPVSQPDGGISPLIAGIAVNSPDQPAGSGILSPGSHALVSFDVQIDDGVADGTIISNQGHVASQELPVEPTDADGDPSNGHQPTVIVVGEAQQLAISKEVLVVDGGAAEAGKTVEYVIRVTNIGSLPATGVVINDDLSPPLGDQLGYIAGSATLNGSTNGVSYAPPMLSADYASVYGDLLPNATAELRFQAEIDPGLAIATRVSNTAEVTWNSPRQTESASAEFDVGGVPGSAILNGSVWHDANFNHSYDNGERWLEGWNVEIYRDGQRIGSVFTDDAGRYSFSGLAPNDGTAESYELRFTAAGAGFNAAMLGMANSPFTDGLQRISDIVAASGTNLQDLNLPIDPNGTVYDSIYRTPLAGATLTMVRAGSGVALPASCFDDPQQQDQTTGRDGYYKFDLNFSSPACPSGADYLIDIAVPPGEYTAAPSRLIPPQASADTGPFEVVGCAGSANDMVPGTTDHCEAQASELPPPAAVAPRTPGTAYYLHLTLGNGSVPGDSQLFNNHIPIDPEIDQTLTVTKTSALVNVTRGQLVPYTITVNNSAGVILHELNIVDSLPAGFKYVEGSARMDGRKAEPEVDGRVLSWEGLDMDLDAQHKLDLLAIVGAGVSEGEYVNRAQAFDAYTGAPISGDATATVRVVPDPTFDCTDIVGKVFDDANSNGRQDPGEPGLAGVRIVSARGLIVTTDQHGRYHLACAAVPDEDRGSNFILKLDDRSLPSGYRLTTENPLVQRTTRGKMIKFNFGATVHRVVSLSVAEDVFEPDTTEMRIQWLRRLDLLIDELRKGPSILRISYLADIEDPALVQKRNAALKRDIAGRWEQLDCCQPLTIETEVFWRRGGPPEKYKKH